MSASSPWTSISFRRSWKNLMILNPETSWCFKKLLFYYFILLKVYENCVKAYVHQGRAYLGLKRYDDAVASYERAILSDPKKENSIRGKLNKEHQLIVSLLNNVEKYCYSLSISEMERKRGAHIRQEWKQSWWINIALFSEYISEVERARVTDDQEAAAEEFAKTESIQAKTVPEVGFLTSFMRMPIGTCWTKDIGWHSAKCKVLTSLPNAFGLWKTQKWTQGSLVGVFLFCTHKTYAHRAWALVYSHHLTGL